MKRNILLLLTSFIFFMAADAQAQVWLVEDCCHEDHCMGLYAKAFGGANFLQNTSIDRNRTSYETGYIVAGSLGCSWGCGLRLEGQYAYRRNDIKKIHFYGQCCSKQGHFQTSSYMANLLWDLPASSWNACWDVQPFVGAGVGYDFQQLHSTNCRVVFNQKWDHFAWQVIAGLAYPICHNTKLTLEYTFHQGDCHFNNHSVGLGLVYKFDLKR